MDKPEHSADIKRRSGLWFAILSVVWIVLFIIAGMVAYENAAAELAKETGISHWWHNNDPQQAFGNDLVKGIVSLPFVALVAYLIALFQTASINTERQKRLELQSERERHDFAEQVSTLERESAQQADLSQIAQSKQEFIMRLGTIDQYLRVLSMETDIAKRTVALQAAHSELTTLTAKLASGQLSREAIHAVEIREQASETCNDLARLGLSEDRLNRDIIRIFHLF